MRRIEGHQCPDVAEDLGHRLRIEEVGGVVYFYYFHSGQWQRGPSFAFHEGPVEKPTGLSMEALLAVVADRLRQHQAGPTAGRENALALTKTEEALHWLHAHKRDRAARKVLGEAKP